jgi:hypothetical protein
MITDASSEQTGKKLPTDFKGSETREKISIDEAHKAFPELKILGTTEGNAADDLRIFLGRVDRFRRNEQLARAVKAIEDLAAAHRRKEDISRQLRTVQEEINIIAARQAERQKQRNLAEADKKMLDQAKRSTQEAQKIVQQDQDLETADAEALALLQKMHSLYQEDPTRGSGAAQ